MHDYIINAITIRECNFAIGTILGKGFAQALVHTVHSTRAFGNCAWAKPFPKIVPMVKLDIWLSTLINNPSEHWYTFRQRLSNTKIWLKVVKGCQKLFLLEKYAVSGIRKLDLATMLPVLEQRCILQFKNIFLFRKI